jgi:DNA-binding NarL/FixJ family response regulator
MIRLVLADDHAIFREGLKQILAEHDDLEIVGEATNGQELLGLLSSPCDVVLLDLSMPGRSGIALLTDVVAKIGSGRVIVLSMHDEHQYVIESLKAGAAGYVTKNSASQQLIQAIRKVANDEMFVSATASQSATLKAVPEDEPHRRLTPREREIFNLLVDGRKISDIARKLDLSVKTVSTHKTNILLKFDAATVVDLVHYAMRHGLGPGPV